MTPLLLLQSSGRSWVFRQPAGDLDRIRPLTRIPEITLQLHSQPMIRRAPTKFFQPDCHIGRQAVVAVQQVRQRLAGNTNRPKG
jgi:hypothetical protein